MRKNKMIVLGAGCFWCSEAIFKRIEGVIEVMPGYSGGKEKDPNYKNLSRTGHAEVVKIEYDSDIISFDDILDIFFKIHDPTTLDRQGNDIGHQYRSIILYDTDEEKIAIEKKIRRLSKTLTSPIVTEVKRFVEFYEAEEYHKDYYEKNKDAPYCRFVILPKLNKLKLDKPTIR